MTNEQLCALAKQGDAEAQNQLIENNLRFIKKTAYEVWSAQAELNRSLQISLDDLVQEGSLWLFGCIDSYNPDSGNLFLTYAASAIRNAMIDYIRSQNVSFEAKNLNNIISLDELAKDEVQSKHNFIADPTKQTPEQIYLAQERHDDIHRALEMIEAREERYLRYRFGFEDDTEHPLTETAKRFHLSESRAKKTEAQALDNVWLELPWWYEQRRTFLLASIIEAWIVVSKKIDEMMDERSMTFWGNESLRRALYTFCAPSDAAQLPSPTCALLHHLHPKNKYPQASRACKYSPFCCHWKRSVRYGDSPFPASAVAKGITH